MVYRWGVGPPNILRCPCSVPPYLDISVDILEDLGILGCVICFGLELQFRRGEH